MQSSSDPQSYHEWVMAGLGLHSASSQVRMVLRGHLDPWLDCHRLDGLETEGDEGIVLPDAICSHISYKGPFPWGIGGF